MSWAGKILRVNLTAGTVKSEPLNMEWARSYLGSRGLGSKYLISEIDPKVDPLSPDNKIIWATGPLTGTMASTGGRYTVITKGPLTGAIACSNSGGYWGAELKMAGWDMIIFEGKSDKPVYLYINDDDAELRDASHLWGQSVWKTEEMLKTGLQDPLLRVSSIGKSGENGVLYAAVVNDLHRAAGRSGVGAVMGSKNLKAIAVRGTKGVGNIRDPKAFMKVTFEKKKILAENAVTGQGLPAYGTQVLMNVINEMGALPTRNHRDVQFEGAKDISAEAMATPRESDGKKHLVTNQACFGCTIACGRISKMDEGHFTVANKPQYWGANGGLEYEAAWALGAANGVNDLEALQYANMLCNEEGFDPISFGATVGAVMELYEMGVLTAEQLGIDAKFGSAQALAHFAEITAKGEGFGKEIGQGSKRLTEKYGHPDLSMSVKGQEFPAYDGRAIQGIGLAYATSNRGACHLRGYTIASEVLGIPVKTDPVESEGKPELVKAFQDATAAFDSSGLCVFTTFAWGVADLAPQLQAACNEEFTTEELEKIGERIWNMEREFNNAAGFTAKDDNLPKRLLTEAAKTGASKGMVSKLPEMLPKYYAARGWDPEGRPTAETKARLSL
ncbi:MAG TPA: aldehyde ferredoxin oxidoreductase [Hydrogenophaga sp.]|jgi:aldehyde:ferredoxin oxidoreductase|uniref:aldehyde ferredoxin oxidoreductase family protein n=1 Tax=Hydrogenophaga TaxID=47420 RepID=UPI0003F46F85|nr:MULTISPECIES: aldehyde ferredoxin oxidoreductase family protein [Hydrogenophaga]EWS64947.1 putative oxidoreductase YdhV [Hydrogenophaga sp. T4]MBU4183384.1 aldehyde ferredoxin oxidoreductase family protein [Gammaproteobacteria bacterium]MBW8467199.1 aldehyde ferredoxin oxidoreductase family protein [Thiobacillus sp.]OGA76656.1 MAG: aldehyde ferredoxin oxidoreductase [Burkholderiales bacterium GWE1_65_30]OGA91572.1 MAG: aldehyde ferredoxin oxidoreductase [Burkholderiales bacterium GWF1_66_17